MGSDAARRQIVIGLFLGAIVVAGSATYVGVTLGRLPGDVAATRLTACNASGSGGCISSYSARVGRPYWDTNSDSDPHSTTPRRSASYPDGLVLATSIQLAQSDCISDRCASYVPMDHGTVDAFSFGERVQILVGENRVFQISAGPTTVTTLDNPRARILTDLADLVWMGFITLLFASFVAGYLRFAVLTHRQGRSTSGRRVHWVRLVAFGISVLCVFGLFISPAAFWAALLVGSGAIALIAHIAGTPEEQGDALTAATSDPTLRALGTSDTLARHIGSAAMQILAWGPAALGLAVGLGIARTGPVDAGVVGFPIVGLCLTAVALTARKRKWGSSQRSQHRARVLLGLFGRGRFVPASAGAYLIPAAVGTSATVAALFARPPARGWAAVGACFAAVLFGLALLHRRQNGSWLEPPNDDDGDFLGAPAQVSTSDHVDQGRWA